MSYTKKEFLSHTMTIQINGFVRTMGVQALIFTRESDDKSEQVVISYRDYEPLGYILSCPAATITFKNLEAPLNLLMDKHNIQQRYGDCTIQSGFLGGNININYSVFEQVVNDLQSFSLLSEEIQKVINLSILPFFEKYQTLNDVHEVITKMTEEQISEFLVGIVGIKLPLIKKVINSPDFKAELTKQFRFYSEEVFKYPQYFKDHDKVFNELFKDDI